MCPQTGSSRTVGVLLAGKDEWTSRSYESILVPQGYVVHKTYTRRQTLERIRREAPHVILLDVHLPDADGHDFCRELRAEGLVTPSTPILLTAPGPATRRDRMAARLAGAWDRLGPPLDPDELLAIVGTFSQARLDADAARAEGLIDQATGLYNADGITRRAREMGSLASRHHRAIACVLLELAPTEGTKPKAADPAGLQQVAEALKLTARRSDAVGRVGPQMFAILADDTTRTLAPRVAERLAHAIRAVPDAVGGARLAAPIQLHGGCDGVTDPATPVDPLALIEHAGVALGKARLDPGKGWLRQYSDNGD